MVKTNAQTTVNYGGVNLLESDDKMLIRLKDGFDDSTHCDSMRRKINSDPDFFTASKGSGGYFLLERTPASSISKSSAISNYRAHQYVASAAFVFQNSLGDIWGTADDIFVKLKSTTTVQDMENEATAYGLLSYTQHEFDADIYKLYISKYQDVMAASVALAGSGLFELVEPNYYMNLVKQNAVYGERTNSSRSVCTQTFLMGVTEPFIMNTPYPGPYSNQNFAQWSLYTGLKPTEFNSQYLLPYNSGNDVAQWADINICNAWGFKNGSTLNKTPVSISGQGINVSIVDDGVDTKNSDLTMRYTAGGSVYGYDPVKNRGLGGNPIYTGINYDPGCPDVKDPAGIFHGTSIGGIIAAKRNSSLIAGIAYDSKIMPVHSYWNDVPGDEVIATTETLSDGIYWSAQEGADIINCSWGYHSYPAPTTFPAPYEPKSSLIDNAIQFAVTNGRNGKGSVMVFSSGNNNYSKISWPSSNTNVISVGASNMCHERKKAGNPLPATAPYTYPGGFNGQSCDGEIDWGSNYGTGDSYYDPWNGNTLNTGGRLSLMAPGVKIPATTVWRPIEEYFNGTSSAAPHVAGVAALMLSVNPCLTYQEVKDILELSTEKVTPINMLPPYSYTNFTGSNGTYNNQMGYGKLNAGNAVTLAYDMYKQNKTETGTKTYKSAHFIFAGQNVTDILTSGYYTVSAGANIVFHAPTTEAIILDEGFEAQTNSVFTAELFNDPCNNNHGHYKRPPGISKVVATDKEINFTDGDVVSHVKLYPNPAKTAVNLEFTLVDGEKATFTITNIVGQKISETYTVLGTGAIQAQSLSVADLVPGIYLVEMQTSKGIQNLKFIKE
jgi:subtilisin family serine protease